MKFSQCVLCLLFANFFVLSISPEKVFVDGVEETIDVSNKNKKLYICMKIPKSGYISLSLSLKEKKIHKLDKENFKFGLSPSNEINNVTDNNITFANFSDEYKISFYVEKGNNEYVFVNIEPLTVDNKATIKLTFFPEFQGSAIITIILVALNIIFLIAFIIFKKCFKKKKI